jgi:glucan phosphoethanolaminetransferase (alkaline phosphatase superfamily)
MERHKVKLWLFVGVCLLLTVLLFAVDRLLSERHVLKSGLTLLQLAAIVAMTLSLSALFNLATHKYLAQKKKPACEGIMVGRLY